MSPLVRVSSWLRMGNNIVLGPAFEVLPGRKLEKIKGNKAERSKKGFFSLCTGSQTGAKSSIFEHNSASLAVSPSSFPFKDLVAKGHSSFYFSSRTGSLEHAPVSGKLVASSLRGLHRCVPVASEVSDQAIFLEECRRDPEFRKRVLGLERMLRVKAQKETNISDFDNGIDSGLVAQRLFDALLWILRLPTSLGLVLPLLRRLR